MSAPGLNGRQALSNGSFTMVACFRVDDFGID
jgi:hypothetical protein